MKFEWLLIIILFILNLIRINEMIISYYRIIEKIETNHLFALF